MITVKEVQTKREQREFLNFPLDLYRGNPYFVPPLYGDEKKIFRKDYIYNDTCEAVYYNAYRDGKMVGRISGILQKAANEKYNEKRVRFTRFDAIDDQAVADALFGAVEAWAKARGMDTICGPLGFSDLEREGLLIEGFDQLSTFEEQYNAPYYQKLIENCKGIIYPTIRQKPGEDPEQIPWDMAVKCAEALGKRDFILEVMPARALALAIDRNEPEQKKGGESFAERVGRIFGLHRVS